MKIQYPANTVTCPPDLSVLITDENKSRILFVTDDSRDAVVAAASFLVILQGLQTDNDTKQNIHKVIRHLTDMVYGFPEAGS